MRVVTFPIKKRINTELFIDRKQGHLYTKWYQEKILTSLKRVSRNRRENNSGSLFKMTYVTGRKEKLTADCLKRLWAYCGAKIRPITKVNFFPELICLFKAIHIHMQADSMKWKQYGAQRGKSKLLKNRANITTSFFSLNIVLFLYFSGSVWVQSHITSTFVTLTLRTFLPKQRVDVL